MGAKARSFVRIGMRWTIKKKIVVTSLGIFAAWAIATSLAIGRLKTANDSYLSYATCEEARMTRSTVVLVSATGRAPSFIQDIRVVAISWPKPEIPQCTDDRGG